MSTGNANRETVYLDYHASTPVDARVLKAMEPYLAEHFGNASSGQHSWGWTAENAVKKARTQVAKLLTCQDEEVFFTSGATEANNWVLFGSFHQWLADKDGKPFHLITTNTEHSSIMKSSAALKEMGAEVDFIAVGPDGCVSVDAIRAKIKPHTRLISAIWVNNEIGSINPVREIAELAHEKKIYFHSDATQAVGKIAVNLSGPSPDLVSFSAHKLYGPKGVGALYIRSKNPAVQIKPLLFGGGHERGLRAGTLNVPGIVGMGAACEISLNEGAAENARMAKLRDLLQSKLVEGIPGAHINGSQTARSPINLSITFPGRPVEMVVGKLTGLGFSTGSACSAGRILVSHVLAAVGVSEADAGCTLRLSVGRHTTEEQILSAAARIVQAFQS